MAPNENPFKVQRIYNRAKMINLFDIYLSGDLGSPEDYQDEFELIRNMTEEDILTIHYNGQGGNAFTMIQFLRCFQECKGTIVGSVEGECQSAYTFMFLASDGFEVSDHVKFMCHNYNTGMFGSGHELRDEMAFDVNWSENLMRESYKDFLSEEEIDQLLEGKVYYFNMEEILSRCQNMVDVRQAEQEKEMEQEAQDVVDSLDLPEVMEDTPPEETPCE